MSVGRRVSQSRTRTRRSRVAAWSGLAVLATFLAVVPLPQSLTPTASAAASLQVSQDIPGQTLIGSETPVEVTFDNTGDQTAFNIAFSVTLPPGVTVSSSDQAPARTIVETNAAGDVIDTVVTWENLVDIRAGILYRFHYSLQHQVGSGDDLWEVGETVNAPVETYYSTSDATVPRFQASGSTNPVTAVSPSGAGIVAGAPQPAPGSTVLVPILLTKSEPSPEGELLRGVHDHQTVFTLTGRTGSQGGVGVTTLEDWVPAGLEFLGCGTEDNSSGEEYPGSGPLNPGNAPSLDGVTCYEPTSVETTTTVPAGIPAGVYTHVVWDFSEILPGGGNTIPPDTTISLAYVAGIPQRANTMTWPGGAPTPASGDQASNLDNNTGPSTVQGNPNSPDGPTYTNYVQASTEFEGTTTTVDAQESVQAVDLAMYKTVDTPTIEQGGTSTWTLHLRTSEYVTDGGISGLTVTDTTPDGTCPIGQVGGTAVDPECSGTTTPPPSPAYSAATYDASTGETTLTWDIAGSYGPNVDDQITFSTVALTDYPGKGHQVSANDSWTNHADLEGHVETFGQLGPNLPLGFTDRDVTDDTNASQSGTAITFRKDVGVPGSVGADCGDGTDVTWDPDVAEGVGPGDRVCFRLTAKAPDLLNTRDVSMVDFLPPGLEFEDGSNTPGPDNEVAPLEVEFQGATGTSATGQRLDWRLLPGDSLRPAKTAQVVFSALLTSGSTDDPDTIPDFATSGDELTNSARFSFQNTNGEVFVQPDNASVDFSEAHLTLDKSYAGETVRDAVAGDDIDYAITVTNDGTKDATNATVWDLLPRNVSAGSLDATCFDISAISDGGACQADTRIAWTGLDIPAGDSVTLHYTWTIDSAPIATQWTNHAGVVDYHSSTNTGSTFEYVPRANIDTTRENDANTDSADDIANVYSPGITLTKTRTTSITEDGNAGPDQATIGEVIHYSLESRQPSGTSVDAYHLVDDLTGTGQTLVAGSTQIQTDEPAPGAACTYGAPSDGSGLETGNGLDYTDPGPFEPTGVDYCIRITFDAVVDDVAANVRPGHVTNTATLDYQFDDDGAGPNPAVGGSASGSIDTALVEPDISITKSSGATGTVLPGSEVPYSLVVTNNTGAQVSTAHDIHVDDTLPGVIDAVVDNPDGGSVGGGHITWDIATLAPGESVTLSFTIRLQDNLVANSTFTNTALVTTTSIGAPDDEGGERSASSACSPSTCPGYEDDSAVTLRVAGPDFVKTSDTDVTTVGDEAVYTLTASLPPGLSGGVASISDDLAAVGGTNTLTYLRTISAHCTDCSADFDTSFQTPEQNGTDDTATPRWDLGTIAESEFTRTVTITYAVRVRDLPDTVDGDTLTNTATLSYNGGADTLSDDADVDIAEPDVTIDKTVETDVEPTPAAAVRGRLGGTVTYHLTLTNDSDWPAYDVAVIDEPDTVQTDGCDDDSQLEVPAGGIDDGADWIATDDTLGPSDSCLVFGVPVIFAHASVHITYTLDIPNDYGPLITGPELVNDADIARFFGLTAGDRASNPDAREYDGPDDTASVNLDGGELGNLVWLDVNGDGLGPDSPGASGSNLTEPGLADVDLTVTWAGPNGTFGDADDETYDRTTDADGRWSTNNTSDPDTLIPAGDYRVVVDESTLPGGLAATYDFSGPPDGVSETTITENGQDLDQDFGYAGTGSLGDTVWYDVDGSGAPQDTGEPGIPGVDVQLTWSGPDGLLATTADNVDYGTQTTDGTGRYSFTDLPAGPFRATVDAATLPAGLTATYDLTPPANGIATRDLGAGEDAVDVDFGYTGTGSVGDTVWLDLDSDGTQDADEPGISGVDVQVVWSGFDGAFGGGDDVTVDVTTDADGKYLVDRLPEGDVRVTVDDTTLPGGLTPTFDLDGTGTPHTAVRSLDAGEDARDVDFGYIGSHEIGDMVWLDVNGDGDGPRTPGDPGEPGVPGQRVRVVWAGQDDTLDTADDVVLGTPQTGADGGWSVDGVPDGTVRATLVGAPASTLRVSYDREGALDGVGIADVTADDLDFDFGLAGTGSIGDTVWLDFNRNGTVDAGEPRIPDADVTVTWAGFDSDLSTAGDNVDYGTYTTDADGEYLAENLPPGLFRVNVDPGSLPGGVVPAYDLDGIGTPHVARRQLTSGEDARDVDFGYAGEGRIGDFIWWDLNGDGIQDPDEPGLAGVGVTLDWAGFDGVFGNADDGRLVTSTDADGGYLFTGLPAGDYRVTVDTDDLPDGVTPTYDPDGGDDSTSELTLAGGASDLDQDFGYVGDSEIGDLVWRDTNRDGTRQDDEKALADVRVTVTYLGPDGVEGGGDDVAISQRTGNPPEASERRARAAFGGAPIDDDPFYLVSGLAPGKYVVTLDGSTVKAPDAPISDLDGGDPTVTRLTLTDDPELDADFAVFENDVPTFDGGAAAGAGISVECDGSVAIDPFAFVTDPNGDRLRVVRGSIVVPGDVTATLADNGKLRISTTGDADFTVRYQVADGRGGVVQVAVPVEVSKDCADGGGLPGSGSDIPAWLVGLGLGLVLAGAGALVIGLRRRRA